MLDSKLLKATDLAGKGRKINRSALIRHALQEPLKRLDISDLEERDRRGYGARPQKKAETKAWDEAAA